MGFRQEQKLQMSPVLRVTPPRATQEASTSQLLEWERRLRPRSGSHSLTLAWCDGSHSPWYTCMVTGKPRPRGSASAEGWPDRRGPGREAETSQLHPSARWETAPVLRDSENAKGLSDSP